MYKILLVEDEEKVSAFIRWGLEEHNYIVIVAADGATAQEMFATQKFDLIILDVMLPDTSGVDLCARIRQVNHTIPILMLTALAEVENKVAGLQAGADDYLAKPFHFMELTARIKALLRRTSHPEQVEENHVLTYNDLKLDLWSKTAERDGKQINLTAKEYALLELFMKNPNKTLSRDYIAERVWGIEFDTGTNFIDVYVNYLRNKIEKGFSSKLIHTVIGMGYILKADKAA
ncbi:response regulator transcription factor [Mucilaginibacter sp. Bleaf8]|uniref:response regulator transcription factor n=1 Tax=Mucilaginibacter sp. Bleaf8 TaxID=2834430 RepID=UPI001BD1BB06|nr:response regulator transcription factor [Mucilaginibacter sp. Bleaf8]MBS7564441.1 response regulator transcription factor [Mucilaginibacter sp. Bleaf8]